MATVLSIFIILRFILPPKNEYNLCGSVYSEHFLFGFTYLVEVLAQQSSGLRGRQVTELGHEIHLPLGEHTGRSPKLSLSLSDGFILILNRCIQSLNCLVQLEKRSLLLVTSE